MLARPHLLPHYPTRHGPVQGFPALATLVHNPGTENNAHKLVVRVMF